MNYRGSIKLRFRRIINPSFKRHDIINTEHNDLVSHINADFKCYSVGDRVGQIIILPYPTIEFNEVDTLSETERGEGGFGSTGK